MRVVRVCECTRVCLHKKKERERERGSGEGREDVTSRDKERNGRKIMQVGGAQVTLCSSVHDSPFLY